MENNSKIEFIEKGLLSKSVMQYLPSDRYYIELVGYIEVDV